MCEAFSIFIFVDSWGNLENVSKHYQIEMFMSII